MKTIMITLVSIILIGNVINAQTPGELSVSVATSETVGEDYAPRNIIAVWIEDDAGNFVKTLLAYAEDRITHLNTWEASTTDAGSTYNVVDAITGATQSSHSTRTCTWDGTNVSGTLVSDGTYNVNFELTDKNSTGNHSSFSFTKGVSADSQTPTDEASFSSVSIDWSVASSSVHSLNDDNYNIYPNPSVESYTVSGNDIIGVEILNMTGALIYKSDKPVFNLNNKLSGTYIINIITENGIITKKIMKQ